MESRQTVVAAWRLLYYLMDYGTIISEVKTEQNTIVAYRYYAETHSPLYAEQIQVGVRNSDYYLCSPTWRYGMLNPYDGDSMAPNFDIEFTGCPEEFWDDLMLGTMKMRPHARPEMI